MAVERARVKTSVEKQGNCVRVIEVEVDPAELSDRMDKLFTELVPTVSVPGFRPGRAPKRLVERKFKKTVRQEAVDKVVADSIETVCEMEDLQPVAEPSIEDVKSEPDQPLTYRLTLETAPVVELGNYKHLKLEKQVQKVTDKDVDAAIERMRQTRATMEPVNGRPAHLGEFVVFDMEVTDGDERVDAASGEGLGLWLQEEPDVPDLQQLLLGKEPGEEFDGDVTWPENSRLPVAGKTVHVRGMVKELKQRVVPELDDEFANEIDPDVNSVAELLSKVREALEQEAEQEADRRLRQTAISRVVESSTYELPRSLVERLAYENLRDRTSRMQMYGVPLEVLRERHSDIWDTCQRDAEEAVKVHATLNAIARKEGVEVSDEEIEEEIRSIRAYGERMRWNLDRLDEYYAQSSTREDVQSRLIRKRAIELVIDSAKVKRKEVKSIVPAGPESESTAEEDER